MYDILIVDDEAVERQVIRFLLDKFGFPFRITEAANGQQALAFLEKRRFHVLFTDIKMPFVDGLELAKQARELYPDLHIVFFSGFDDFEYARQALSLRIVNYVPGLIGFACLELFLSGIPFVRTLCTKLSAISYELYLVHLMILATVFHFAQPQSFLMGVLCAAVSFALSVAGAYLFQRIIRKVTSKRSGPRQ